MAAEDSGPVIYRIEEDGVVRDFVVADDEISVTGPAGPEEQRRLSGIEPRSRALARVEAIRRAGGEAALVLYPKDQPRTKAHRRVLTRRVTVRLAQGTDAAALAAKLGVTTQGELSFAPGYAVFVSGEPAGAPALAEKLRGEPGVLFARPMLERSRVKRMIPNDPLFGRQWVLQNTGQNGALPGIDVNVAGVWDRFRGKGILVTIVDDGLEMTHPDLAANANTGLGYDYRDDDDDPSPSVAGQESDTHGTAVAGVCAAVGNNGLGVAGSAFEATLIGVRLIGGDSSDEKEGFALAHSNSIVAISNNSWGPDDDGKTKGGADVLAKEAIKTGAEKGRGGRGTIFMWAAGNGGVEKDNANYDSYNSSIYTISVGALNDLGARALYSEKGACLVVVAPAGLDPESNRMQATVTTDLTGENGLNPRGAEAGVGPVWPQEVADTDYTQGFNGTSSATPLASGVVALVLQANPNLGWRDVQEVLIRSATKVSPDHSDWMTNSAGLHFNHDFGAGLINGRAAVDTALAWKNLGPQKSVQRTAPRQDLGIPDNNAAGVVREFDLSDTHLRVEQVTVSVDIKHPHRGDLSITLTSPSGTVSRLMEVHDDPNADLVHTMESVFNWGEDSRGTWKVRIADGRTGNAGILQDVQLNIFGAEFPAGGGDLGSLEYEFADTQLSIMWDPQTGGVLETAGSLSGPWLPVSGAGLGSGVYTVDTRTAPRAFYRLRR